MTSTARDTALAQQEPEPEPRLPGRPRQELQLTEQQLAQVISPDTLRNQCGFNLKARALAIEEWFQTPCSEYQLRRLYRDHGISRQRMVYRLGASKLPSMEK